MEGIALDILTVMGMEPLPYIKLAAGLGCRHIGMSATPIVRIPEIYPEWSLRDNPSLVRDVKVALLDHGISIQLGEGFLLNPDTDLEDFARDLDILADVGAHRIGVCSFDADHARTFDALAGLAQMAADRGMDACIEFVPSLGIADLASAVKAARHVGQDGFGIIIDAMHLFRSGATVADVAALDPTIIKHVQICDVPWGAPEEYAQEACFGRRCPGDGDLPLEQLIVALPAEVIVGVETPMRARVIAGDDPASFLEPCVAAVSDLVQCADRRNPRPAH